jgi:hypothetical protein
MGKTIHGRGLMPTSTPKQRTWCGRMVTGEQLPVIGTNRKLSCKTCIRIHAPMAAFWARQIRRGKREEKHES